LVFRLGRNEKELLAMLLLLQLLVLVLVLVLVVLLLLLVLAVAVMLVEDIGGVAGLRRARFAGRGSWRGR
jgi:hypothetical protein